MRNLRVASVQFQHAPGDKPHNLSVIKRFVEQAADAGVELVLFPECCISGYWHLRHLDRDQLEELAEPVPEGPSVRELRAWSEEYKMTISAGLVEKGADGRLFNSAVVAMPDGSFACHRKLHCFISQHLCSGDQFTVFDTPHGCRAAVLICYDNNIVENVRCVALAGAELLLAPHQTGGCRSGSPFAMGRIDPTLWDRRAQDPDSIEAEFRGDKGRGWLMRWLPARAHDNGLFLIFSNGVGLDDDEVRTGGAMVLDPYGRTIVETCQAADTMIVANLDGSLRERCTGVRWIRTRRPELYGPLTTPTGREEDTRTVRFEHESG